ncbi:C-type lectin-like [Trinorchestia longiramus]|nr:C-type lectin-like [Trinorchestia longiramus]
MQLFCVTNGVCNIWDSQSLLVSEPTFQISDDHCMILEGCDYPGSSEKLAVGSTVQSDDCNLEYLFVCSPNGLMKPAVEATQALTTCENPFITTDVGCLLISEERMTFPEARTLCLTYAADLFVAQSTDELSLLTDYIDATHGRNSAYWVGVQKVNNNWQWFNGRPVDNAEIHIFSNLPNERFARLEHNGKFLLADISCDHSFGTVCRATV